MSEQILCLLNSHAKDKYVFFTHLFHHLYIGTIKSSDS